MAKQYIVVAVGPGDSYRNKGLEGCVIEEVLDGLIQWKDNGSYHGDFKFVHGKPEKLPENDSYAFEFYCWKV
jgi:hypothetical protein